MALKPTIYKAKISLAHVEANYYDELDLTLALHPSETLERMMARVLAFCMNAESSPSFTKGLSTAEEPDIWAHTLDSRIALWIDMGEPAFDRIKKATRVAEGVKVFAFHSKSDTWWKNEGERFGSLGAEVYQFQWQGIQGLAGLADRTMALSVTISDQMIYVSADAGEAQIPWRRLQ